jgi:hypothetical protein
MRSEMRAVTQIMHNAKSVNFGSAFFLENIGFPAAKTAKNPAGFHRPGFSWAKDMTPGRIAFSHAEQS